MSDTRPDLSICLAAIRKDNWRRLYDSIVTSLTDKYTFELVFCGPHAELPEDMKDLKDVSCIVDFGCPTRAQQIACIAATGEYMAYTADDGWFYKDKLAECLDELKRDENSVALVTRYTEGGRDGLTDYTVGFHIPTRSPNYPSNYLIFNSAIFRTQLFKDLGGFDCRFESLPLSFTDFGVRVQRLEKKVTIASFLALSNFTDIFISQL